MSTDTRPTFAGDETGDASFAFDKGASSHFVLALIATAHADVLYQALAELRSRRGLPASYEFKFHRLSSATLRRAVFETLATLPFEAWALTVDKTALPAYWRALDSRSLYALLMAELIAQIPLVEREGAVLLLDQFDPRGKALLVLQRALKRRQIRRGFRKMTNVRSHNEPLVQIADLVAGAILQQAVEGDIEPLSCVQNLIRLTYRFEPDPKNPPS